MARKRLIKDMIVLSLSVTALVCAALNMHISLNMLEAEETSEEDKDNEETTV